jgi:CMD domain protein
MSDPDIIDKLAGLAPDSPLVMIRDRKPVTRQQAQESFRALFEAAEVGDVSLRERFAVACFVAGLHGQEEIAAFYVAGLRRAAPADEFVAALTVEISQGRTAGPYGAYPTGPLNVEDVTGPTYQVAEPHRLTLGLRLAAALAHVHMLVFHPRDASAASLQGLLDAGWSNAGIVTISQLVAFLAFQIRVAAGLRALAGGSGVTQ